MADEKKTLKFQMMMSPAEAGILDDWMFKNRIRSRAEAIRRLCQIGLILDSTVEEVVTLADGVKDLVADHLPSQNRHVVASEGSLSLYLQVHQLSMLAHTLAAASGTLKEQDDSSLSAVNERKERLMKAYQAGSEVIRKKDAGPLE